MCDMQRGFICLFYQPCQFLLVKLDRIFNRKDWFVIWSNLQKIISLFSSKEIKCNLTLNKKNFQNIFTQIKLNLIHNNHTW